MPKFWSVNPGNPLHYLRIYINFCYFAGLLPFRIVFEKECRSYKLQTSPWQKSFCILVMTLCICEEIITLRDVVEDIRNPPEDNRSDPMIYFEMFSLASNFIYYGTVFRTIWCKSKKFLGVIQYLNYKEEQSLIPTRQNSNLKAQVWFAFSLLPFIIYPVTFVSAFFIRLPELTWDQRIGIWGKSASKIFFGEAYFDNFPYFLKLILGILRNIFLLAYTQLTTSMEMLGITSVLMMSDSVDEFRRVVKNAKDYSSTELLKEYGLLRTLSRKLNEAVGCLTFGLTLACLPYYISNLLEFINPANIAVFLRHLMFFTNSFGFLILASQINKTAHMLEEGLLSDKDFSDLSTNDLSIFLHDLSSHNIGINGSGFFMVSPSFVGTIISLLLTFSIIIIQFQNSNFPIPAITR